MAFQPVPTYQDPVEVDPRTGKSQFNPTWLSWFLTLSNGGLSNTIQHNSLLGLQGGVSGQYYHLTAVQLNSIPFRSNGTPSSITIVGSPGVYQNVDAFGEDIILKGSTITLIEFSRNGSTYYDVGLTQGMFFLSPNDYIRVTSTGTFTATKVPR